MNSRRRILDLLLGFRGSLPRIEIAWEPERRTTAPVQILWGERRGLYLSAQIVIVLPLGALLRRVDARWVLAFGTILIGIACLMGTNLTSQWATDDFLPSQILQAIGQSFALTALIVLIVQTIHPADALTIGSLFRLSRLFGGEIGTAFMQTFVRVREQVHSNLIGLHVDGLAGTTIDRLSAYRGAVGTRSADVTEIGTKAAKLLANAVAQQAAVLSYIDGFLAAAAGAFVCLLLVALVRRPPPGGLLSPPN
jgi:MFS transporter, DHA2 family, multidrug resistance protein